MITHTELKELVIYDPKTGIIQWAKPGRGKSTKSKDANTRSVNKGGYYLFNIKGKMYYCHRLAWFYMMGSFPDRHIDHINGIKTDNRWCNLREVTNQQNHFNQKSKGYSFHKGSGKYQARIKLGGKSIYLGLFETTSQAQSAYLKAKLEYHGKEFSTRLL